MSVTSVRTAETVLAAQGVESGLHALLACLLDCCADIAEAVERGALKGTLGALESANVQGETQKQLDVITNDMLVAALTKTRVACGIASEEEEHAVAVEDGAPFLVLFDPLDGSSNIDVNVTVGTIFSVLPAPNATPTDADFLQAGRRQLAAGYVAYGPSTVLVMSTGQGVQQYVYDRESAHFVLTHERRDIPAETAEFAINAARARHWLAPVAGYVADCQAGRDGPRGRDFNMRWIASMVADVHRIMTRGGVFLYPDDHAMQAAGKAGKLRLMYEANPMGFLVEQAGGRASTGRTAILDLAPDALHQRVPVILGSRDEVAEIDRRFQST
ncbi:MAG: class 1 fructose-bisphosphatase [Pseudomonadota bacterium]